jgi:glucans biosynthesis protein
VEAFAALTSTGVPYYPASIRWGKNGPPESVAHVTATRTAAGDAANTKEIYVDFKGNAIARLDEDADLKTYVTVTGGRLLQKSLQKIPKQHLWRLHLEVARTKRQPVQLRATLYRHGKNMSETWDDILPPSASNKN